MTNQDESLLLEDNARHSYMSVVWSHKIQEKQADILIEKYQTLEIIRVVCTSLTSVGLISLIFVDQFTIKILATIISFVSTVISLLFKSFDIQKTITDHKKAANKLLIIRDNLRLLLVRVNLKNQNTSELLVIYDDLIKQLGQVYEEAPNTTEEAVKRAEQALKISKDNEFSNIEIDANLPETLRWG